MREHPIPEKLIPEHPIPEYLMPPGHLSPENPRPCRLLLGKPRPCPLFSNQNLCQTKNVADIANLVSAAETGKPWFDNANIANIPNTGAINPIAGA